MAEAVSKVGIISCSGEEIPEGTVARQAVRRVLEALRPQQTVTLCLPLFLAGEEGERRFAREHPTITVDGCSKLCAKRGTEKYSGQVSTSLVVSDILGDRGKGCHRSLRDADKADEEAYGLSPNGSPPKSMPWRPQKSMQNQAMRRPPVPLVAPAAARRRMESWKSTGSRSRSTACR